MGTVKSAKNSKRYFIKNVAEEGRRVQLKRIEKEREGHAEAQRKLEVERRVYKRMKGKR